MQESGSCRSNGVKALKYPKRKKVKTAKGTHSFDYITDFRERLLTDMHRYFRSVNWAEMWEDWYLSLDEGGNYKYKSIYAFAKAKGESQEQRSFLLWYLGPPPESSIEQEQGKKYTFVDGPQDWMAKRVEGGWFTKDNARSLRKELTRRFNVLEKMSAVGDSIGVSFMERAQILAARLDTEFRGSLLRNPAGAKVYLDLQERVMDYYTRAQKLYFESLGVNLDDMSGLMTLMTAAAQSGAMLGAAVEKDRPTKEQAALRAFLDMTVQKAARWQLPMPEDAEAKIVDAIVEAEGVTVKKKNVN
jgi:hypothetical protein